MNNRFMTIAIVVLISVFVAITLLAHKVNESLLSQIIAQQAEVLNILRSGSVAQGAGENGRLAAMEQKIDGIAAFFKNARPAEQPPQPPEEDYDKVYSIPLEGAVFKGKAGAPIAIVGFLDLQCPFSARFQPVFDEAVAAYPGKVKYAVKHFPLSFHQEAAPAAKAVLAAGEQGKYFEMMDLILKNNRELGQAKYEEFAKQLGLNVAKFKKDLEVNDKAWSELIARDTQLGMNVDVRGTPTFFIQGKKTMARTVEELKSEIDAILANR